MEIMGYVGNDSVITEKDLKILTRIHTAFAKLRRDGTIMADHLDILGQMERIRKINPAVRIAVSVVPEESDAFTVCSADPRLREKVGRSCAEMITRYHFDGVDFDWEFPCVPSNGVDATGADKHNFTLFCQAVRRALDATGRHPTLSVAAGADLYYVESVEIPELAKVLDYICVMTYDLKCGFHALTGHHTALFSSTGDVFRNSCARALKLFEEYGFPRERLMMGAAFYSRQWKHIPDRNHGFLQLAPTGAGYGPGYAGLAAEYINKNGYVRYWDDEAKAPYLFNGSTFISYDDEKSLGCKCEYVREQGYMGIFYWEHKSDPTGTLLTAIGRAMGKI